MTVLRNIQTQQLSQQLGLSHQMQQAIGLLQMSNLELRITLQQALLTNPILEEREREGELEASLDHPIPQAQVEPRVDPIDLVSCDLSLQEQLQEQSRHLPLPPGLRSLVTYLLDALDDDGYLPASILQQLAQDTGASMADGQAALEHVQQLQPCGIGARSLTECLLLQCREYYPHLPLLQAILSAHPRYLLKQDIQGLANHLQTSPEQIQEGLARIRRLQAFPGRTLAPNVLQPATCELLVEHTGQDWHLLLNEIDLPQLQLNGKFTHWQKGTPQDLAYLRSKTQEATWLLKSLAIRQRTLRLVGESLLKYQRLFFESGPTSLRPLTLRQIADDVQLHESTISRITQNKAISTPYGVFPLKYFFSSKAGKDVAGNDVAAASIRARLAALVAKESRKKPMSDLHLAAALQHDGVVVARRTVAKYREMLGIAKASERRRLI